MEDRNGKKQFIINNGQEFSVFLSKKIKRTVYLKLEASHQGGEYLQKLKSIVRNHPGDINVILYYEGLEKTVLLSEDDCVDCSENCLRKLKDLLGEVNVIVK